jgi:hypothetical protein
VQSQRNSFGLLAGIPAMSCIGSMLHVLFLLNRQSKAAVCECAKPAHIRGFYPHHYLRLQNLAAGGGFTPQCARIAMCSHRNVLGDLRFPGLGPRRCVPANGPFEQGTWDYSNDAFDVCGSRPGCSATLSAAMPLARAAATRS